MRKLLGFFKSYRLQATAAPLFKFMEATLELIVPLIISSIIDTGIAARDTGFIVSRGLLLVLFAVVGFALSATAQYFSARSAIGVCASVRQALFDKIQRFDFTRLDETGASTLETRLTSDVNALETGINLTLRLLLRSPFVVFGAMIVAFAIDAKCALIFALVIAVLLAIVFLILLASVPRHTLVQRELDSITRAARENLAGVRVIRAFGLEESEKAEFSERSARLEKRQLAVGRISAKLNPATLVAVNIAAIILIYSGALRVDGGVLTQGKVVALYNLLAQILVELVKTATLVITLSRSAASLKRINAVLDSPEGEKGGGAIPKNDAPRGRIEFKNVGFTYKNAGAPSLCDISFVAESGQKIGVIGGTGSGKSTLAGLIAGFYYATDGEVLIDGVNVREFDSEALTERVSAVPQRAALIEGSIRTNLLMGKKDANDAELIKALETAQAAEFVNRLENGLDASVVRGGANFSGGQKQRLSIARALVKPSEILILDDSMSALDHATDAKLRRALDEQIEKRTLVMITQRAVSIMDADLIIVLDEGQCVGMGRHNELLDSCRVYREIYEMQTGGEGVLPA